MAAGLVLVAALAMGLQTAVFPDCLTDDAFISFRYASHTAAGQGPVFNPGEPRPVEGYTNFLWTMLLAGLIGVGLEPESAVRWLGLASGLAAMWGSYALAKRVIPGRPLLWPLPALLLAANSFFVLESVQGLETCLFAAFLTGALARLPGDLPPPGGDRSTRRWPLSGLLFGLAALTRPEGILLFGVVAGLRAVELMLARRGPSPRESLWAALALGPVAAHLTFRLRFYGDLLPNTFYAKTGGGLDQAVRGLRYTATGLARIAAWPLLAVFAAIPPLRRPLTARALIATGAVWLASMAGVIGTGGDFKPTFRFLVWTFPLLAVLATAGLAALTGGARSRAGMTAAALLASIALLSTFSGSAEARRFGAQRRQDLALLREAAGWLSATFPPGTVLATGPSGAIPWYTGFTTIDMWGLNDRAIARRAMPAMGSGAAGHEKGDGASVLARRPDVVLFTGARFTPRPLPEERIADLGLSVSEAELLALPEFHRRYSWRSVRLPSATFNYYQKVDPQEASP